MYPETKAMLDKQIAENMEKLKELPIVSVDKEGNVNYDPERKALEKETLDLIDKLEMSERNDMETEKFQEEQRIKEEDLIRKYELEKMKFEFEKDQATKAYWDNYYSQYQQNYYDRNKNRINTAIDFGSKILLPAATTAVGLLGYLYAQKRVFDFEEHGRITSSPGRELKLPRIGKLW